MKRAIARLSLAAVPVFVALGATATPSMGATVHTLEISAPSTVVVGRSFVITVSGTAAPPAEYWNLSWIELVVIPVSTVSQCPGSAQEGASVAEGAGGSILTLSMRPNKDAEGNFSNQIGATATEAGVVLLCGYTANEEGGTLSRASRRMTIVRKGVPRNVRRPRVEKSGGELVCERGRWVNHPRRYSYSWLVNGERRKGATSQRLRITNSLRGRSVQCRVRAANRAGASVAVSRPLRVR